MQALVSRIERTVLRPQPILKMTNRRLSSEIRKLESLLKQTDAANRARHEEISDAQMSEPRAAAAHGEGVSNSQVSRQPSVALDYVARIELRDLLTLRLKLCRAELSRRRFARDRNRGRR